MDQSNSRNDVNDLLDLLRKFEAGERNVRMPGNEQNEAWNEVAERMNRILSSQQAFQERQNLAQHPRLYEKVLNKSPIEVVIFDDQYRYLFVNPTSIKDADTRTWIIGKTDREYCTYRKIDPKVAEERFALYKDVVASGKSLSMEQSMVDREGNKKFYLRTLNPIFDESGQMELLVGYSVDITEVKEKSAELEQKHLALEQANLELDQFVYRASHDLRAPVTSLLGLISLIGAESGLPPDAVEYLKLINRTTLRLDTFIRNIVEYSKNARREVQLEPIDLESMMEGRLEELKHLEKFNHLNFGIDIEQADPFVSDPFRVAILMTNLFSNAIKYSVPGPNRDKVQVSAVVTREEMVVVISDLGEGIPSEYLDRVFDMFFRASLSASGSGIGLYIAKEAVNRLGGHIQITSKQGRGTTVTVNLPNQIGEVVYM